MPLDSIMMLGYRWYSSSWICSVHRRCFSFGRSSSASKQRLFYQALATENQSGILPEAPTPMTPMESMEFLRRYWRYDQRAMPSAVHSPDNIRLPEARHLSGMPLHHTHLRSMICRRLRFALWLRLALSSKISDFSISAVFALHLPSFTNNNSNNINERMLI